MSGAQAKLLHYLSIHRSRVLFRNSEGQCLLYAKVAELAETRAFTRMQRRVVLCLVENDLAELAPVPKQFQGPRVLLEGEHGVDDHLETVGERGDQLGELRRRTHGGADDLVLFEEQAG